MGAQRCRRHRGADPNGRGGFFKLQTARTMFTSRSGGQAKEESSGRLVALNVQLGPWNSPFVSLSLSVLLSEKWIRVVLLVCRCLFDSHWQRQQSRFVGSCMFTGVASTCSAKSDAFCRWVFVSCVK